MNAAPRIPQIDPYAEEFEERRSAPQRGIWGSQPPDPGSASLGKPKPTNIYHLPKRNPQAYIACLDALVTSN